MAIDIKKNRRGSGNAKYWAVAGAILAAFAASYAYASAAKSSSATPAWASGGAQAQYAAAGSTSGGSGGAGGCCGGSGSTAGSTAGSASGGGCCGSGGPQTTVKGATTVAAGVQKVTIDLTTGSYSPNEITAKAGVPLELDFKGPASSCNGYVQSQDLGFSQDVSNGGTIKVGPLKAGTYTFACSMNMYTATIVVK